MKISYLHQYFCTPEMPGGTRSYEIARRLVRRGHEVHIITSDRQPTRLTREWVETFEDGIHVHWTPVPYSNRMGYTERIKAFARFAWRAALRAATLRSDVVFATSTPLTIALPGIFAASRSNAPFVFEVRDLWPELPIAVGALQSPIAIAGARRLEAFAYRRARHIVALSPDMKDGILRRGVAPDCVSVIPNSCDFDLFDVPAAEGDAFRRQHDWLGDRPLVVYCGALGLINGMDYLARTAAEVHRIDPDVRFLVVGAGFQEQAVRRHAEALGVLNRNFFMHGPVPKCEMPRILAAADVATSLFINLPAMWANSANKFFDALAAGRPVAINHEGWLAELVRQRGLGLVLDPVDVVASARALVGFLRNASTMESSRQASRKAARELFDRDVLAAQLEQVLVTAAGAGRGPATAKQRQNRAA
jgi:glycosyltransferase involved in cell wall biosynthesis